MAEVKQEYSSIEITESKVILKRPDGTEDMIYIDNLDEFKIAGTITNGEGDQSYFDANPQGAQPDTPIINIAKHWKRDFVDFNKARGQMGVELAVAGGFNAVTDYEKKIASRMFLAAEADRTTVIDTDTDKKNWDVLVGNTKKARSKRLETARAKISFYLTQEESDDLYDSVQNHFNAYVVANKSNIIKYMNNVAPYDTDGFAQKSYYSDNLKDIFNTIVVDGNY